MSLETPVPLLPRRQIMQTTMMPYETSGSRRVRSHFGLPDDARAFIKRFALRGRDPAVADENLYRYCENEPTDATDPSGLVILSHCPISQYINKYLIGYSTNKNSNGDGDTFYAYTT